MNHKIEKIRHAVSRFLRGKPQANNSMITKELIHECVGRMRPTILEIGCNDGENTLWFLDIFKKPKVYCFEPDPRAIARFKLNIGDNPNVELFEIALSECSGERTFYQSSGYRREKHPETMPEGWDLSGSIKKPKEHLIVFPWVKFDHTIKIKTITLDSWFTEHGLKVIDFIWMDVQGAEMEVFIGGKNTLANTRFIYSEYSDRELFEGQPTLTQLLEQLEDFELLAKFPEDILLRNKKFEFHPTQRFNKLLGN